MLFHSVIGIDVLILAIDLCLKHSKLAGVAEVYNYVSVVLHALHVLSLLYTRSSLNNTFRLVCACMFLPNVCVYLSSVCTSTFQDQRIFPIIAHALIFSQQHQVLMTLRIMQKATGSQLIR